MLPAGVNILMRFCEHANFQDTYTCELYFPQLFFLVIYDRLITKISRNVISQRWATLPGEPLPLDDTEVDDWLPRFVVLHGTCIFLYFLSTGNNDQIVNVRFCNVPEDGLLIIFSDISPQDSTLLSDVVEVGPMPCVIQEEGETRHVFYIVTCYGLRYECSSTSKIQVQSI